MRRKKTLVQKAKGRELVKLTASGRVSVALDGRLKPIIKECISDALAVCNDPKNYTSSRQLNPYTASTKIYKALLEELYHKHFTELHLVRSGKITLSRSQAIAFWSAGYNSLHAMRNPEHNHLMMQLHQKLTPVI